MSVKSSAWGFASALAFGSGFHCRARPGLLLFRIIYYTTSPPSILAKVFFLLFFFRGVAPFCKHVICHVAHVLFFCKRHKVGRDELHLAILWSLKVRVWVTCLMTLRPQASRTICGVLNVGGLHLNPRSLAVVGTQMYIFRQRRCSDLLFPPHNLSTNSSAV